MIRMGLKEDPAIRCVQDTHFRFKNTYKLTQINIETYTVQIEAIRKLEQQQ